MTQQTFRDETVEAPRYDTETVRRVLARAAEIEAQPEPDQLTSAQIEELGAELNLSSEAVRRAFGEVVNVPATESVSTTVSTRTTTTYQLSAKANEALTLVSIPAFLCTVFGFCIAATTTHPAQLQDNFDMGIFMMSSLVVFALGMFWQNVKMATFAAVISVVSTLLGVYIGIITGQMKNHGNSIYQYPLLNAGTIFAAILTVTVAAYFGMVIFRKSMEGAKQDG